MIPKNVQLLINTYKASQLRLIDMIAKAEAKGNVTAYRRAVLADVKQELSSLDKYARKWVSEEIPLSYNEGVNEALKAIDVTKVMTSKKAIKALTDNATDELLEATQYVGRRINDLLKEAGAEAIAEKLSSGDTIKQAKNLMLKKMSDKGITAIKDRRGREISLDAYASMVARTTTREATNTGTMNAMQEVGEDLVRMTSHMSACPICQPLEGRVYSISGKDKRYPPLSTAFPNGYNVMHPNCIHSLTPYIEKFDDDAEATRKESNRPFELDPKKKSQLDAYYAEQKVKAQRRSDYKLWEKSKTLAPDDAPKTFSGFRSMKRANSERYQSLIAAQNRPTSAISMFIRETKTDIRDIGVNDSLWKFIDGNGNLTPEREQLHQDILSGMFAQATPVSGQAEFIVMGGGPAAGKSTMIRSGKVSLPRNCVTINSDDIKVMLPEYDELVRAGRLNDAAFFVHEESSALAKRAMDIAAKHNYNYALDGTGDGSVNSVLKKINLARSQNQRVIGYYITCPTDMAVDRAVDRAMQTGRMVRKEIIVETHKKVSMILPDVAPLFDSIELYDSTSELKLIATGGAGRPLAPVKNQENAFEIFLQKAAE